MNDNILVSITKRHRLKRLLFLIIGSFINTYIYNSFITPNGIVLGGIGGIGVILNKVAGINPIIFYNVITVILVIISIILLGFKKTSYTIIGFIVYTICLNITSLFAGVITIRFDSFLMTVVTYALIDGVALGMLYKTGFNTGGMDVIYNILQMYFKAPKIILSNTINSIIILSGAMVFGINKAIYSIVYLLIQNFMDDKTILGVSDSKICFIKTYKIMEVEKLLDDELEVGYTLINYTNGLSILNKKIIMCIIPTDRFYDMRNELKKIDKKVTIIANDCYNVIGGQTNRILNV